MAPRPPLLSPSAAPAPPSLYLYQQLCRSRPLLSHAAPAPRGMAVTLPPFRAPHTAANIIRLHPVRSGRGVNELLKHVLFTGGRFTVEVRRIRHTWWYYTWGGALADGEKRGVVRWGNIMYGRAYCPTAHFPSLHLPLAPCACICRPPPCWHRVRGSLEAPALQDTQTGHTHIHTHTHINCSCSRSRSRIAVVA